MVNTTDFLFLEWAKTLYILFLLIAFQQKFRKPNEINDIKIVEEYPLATKKIFF